jgi:hypothetical protein
MTAYWTWFENWLLQNAPSLFKILPPNNYQQTGKYHWLKTPKGDQITDLLFTFILHLNNS